jgi:hypothetical protein
MSCCKVANGEFRCGRVQEQLMFRKFDIFLRGVNNALRTTLERRFELYGSVNVIQYWYHQHTNGMTSAGFCVRFCASSSLYTIR